MRSYAPSAKKKEDKERIAQSTRRDLMQRMYKLLPDRHTSAAADVHKEAAVRYKDALSLVHELIVSGNVTLAKKFILEMHTTHEKSDGDALDFAMRMLTND